MSKEISVSELLGENNDDDNINNNENNDEVNNDTSPNDNVEKKPTNKNEEEVKRDNVKNQVRRSPIKKEVISEKELNKIENELSDRANFFAKAINKHDEIVKKKEQEEKEIEEFKVEQELKELEDKYKEDDNKPSPLVIDVENKTKNRAEGLSKLDRVKNLNKKAKSAKLPLFNSNYMIKMYGMNTWIKLDNYQDTFFKEFGFFQNIDKLRLIYENSDFLFKDGGKVDFSVFLEITSPSDINLIYALWSIVNNDGEPIEIEPTCEHCNNKDTRQITPKKILQNSLNSNHTERFKNYDPTKTINELQEDVIMGEEKIINHIIDDELKFKITLSSPNLRRYFSVDNEVRGYIVNELEQYLPRKLKVSTDDTDKLRFLYEFKRGDVNSIYTRFIDHLLYMESIEIIDLNDNNYDNILISIEDDGVEIMIEAIKQIPDEILKKAIDEIEKLSEKEEEINLKGEPYKCRNCNKITTNDNIPVGNILFFTIQKMMEEKQSKRKQN